MTLALVLFALAAVGGLIMAVMRLRGRPLPPFGLAIAHGLAAASGLAVLIFVIARGGMPASGTVGLVLLLAAALGGFLLFSNHLRKQPLPIPLMVIHALVAVAGFLTLLVLALT
jgi:hypothetical protein